MLDMAGKLGFSVRPDPGDRDVVLVSRVVERAEP
jgi:hypothetical protein